MSCTAWIASGGKRSISPVGQHGGSMLADHVVFVGIQTMAGDLSQEPSLGCEAGDDVERDVGSRNEVCIRRVLARVMTDAADARHEDHG